MRSMRRAHVSLGSRKFHSHYPRQAHHWYGKTTVPANSHSAALSQLPVITTRQKVSTQAATQVSTPLHHLSPSPDLVQPSLLRRLMPPCCFNHPVGYAHCFTGIRIHQEGLPFIQVRRGHNQLWRFAPDLALEPPSRKSNTRNKPKYYSPT